jgi:hypothetical protein
MNLSKFPVYVQAAILALVLALVGYLVAQALQFSLKAEVIFAVGLAIGGFVVPLFLAGRLFEGGGRRTVKEERYHETANGQTGGKNDFDFQRELQGLGNQIAEQRQYQSKNCCLHINGKLG